MKRFSVYEFSIADLLKTWILVTAPFRATFSTINKFSMSSIFTPTQNAIILFTESISTEYHRPTVQEIFGMTPSTSLSSCASSSSSPTFRERSHSSSGSSKGRLSGGTIRTHWPFLRNSQDWTVVSIRSGCCIAVRVTTPSTTEGTDVPKYLLFPNVKAHTKC